MCYFGVVNAYFGIVAIISQKCQPVKLFQEGSEKLFDLALLFYLHLLSFLFPPLMGSRFCGTIPTHIHTDLERDNLDFTTFWASLRHS